MVSLILAILENVWRYLQDIKESICYTYYKLLVVVFFASCSFFLVFNLIRTDVDSARYMLSALIQSEAAVIAVVVSLSMVAVQLTSSSYSPKVSENFRKSPDLWLLLTSYIGTIIYSLIVLKTIKDVNSEAIQIHIIFSCSYGFFCFAALIPYISGILEMLRPSSIINALSKEIKRENFFKGDPIYPIINIMKNSIGKYDTETIREGMRSIGKKSIEIFRVEEFDKGSLSRPSAKLFEKHLLEVGYLAVEEGDQNSAKELLLGIQKLGFEAVNRGFTVVAKKAIWLAGEIGTYACKNHLEWTTREAIGLLFSFGENAAPRQNQLPFSHDQKLLEGAEGAAESLERIASIAQENGWEELAKGARENSEKIKKELEKYLEISGS